jgi:hypothetical protein
MPSAFNIDSLIVLVVSRAFLVCDAVIHLICALKKRGTVSRASRNMQHFARIIIADCACVGDPE